MRGKGSNIYCAHQNLRFLGALMPAASSACGEEKERFERHRQAQKDPDCSTKPKQVEAAGFAASYPRNTDVRLLREELLSTE